MLNSTVTLNSVSQIMQHSRELSMKAMVLVGKLALTSRVKSVKLCASASVETAAVMTGESVQVTLLCI
jgi:hypothetical protein